MLTLIFINRFFNRHISKILMGDGTPILTSSNTPITQGLAMHIAVSNRKHFFNRISIESGRIACNFAEPFKFKCSLLLLRCFLLLIVRGSSLLPFGCCCCSCCFSCCLVLNLAIWCFSDTGDRCTRCLSYADSFVCG